MSFVTVWVLLLACHIWPPVSRISPGSCLDATFVLFVLFCFAVTLSWHNGRRGSHSRRETSKTNKGRTQNGKIGSTPDEQSRNRQERKRVKSRAPIPLTGFVLCLFACCRAGNGGSNQDGAFEPTSQTSQKYAVPRTLCLDRELRTGRGETKK